MDEIEIPEAIRENLELPKKSGLSLSMPLIIGIVICIGVMGLVSLWLFSSQGKPVQPKVSVPTTEPKSISSQPQVKPQQQTQKSLTTPITEIEPDQEKVSKKDLLGHLPYDVAPKSELIAITADGNLKMRSSAAHKFQQMQAAAKAEGIILAPISAFRDDQAQEQLFFSVKEQRGQDAVKRAEVSAPPGYSEHHTGYAIDIGDGNAPATNLETDFADTAAFRWLEQNALKYSFELSFPPNNKQGVSYEPWHWRFVGDRDSLETFYKVRN
ncbi:MAG: M15 family metallopeptidase [Waterburya sp.]